MFEQAQKDNCENEDGTCDNEGHIHIGADYLTDIDSWKNLIEIWGNTEEVLQETLNKLGTNMNEALKLMEISLEDTIKTIQNSRKELK